MWRHNLVSLQCDAAHLPLEDASVDLIVTSPPYFQMRSYQQGGQELAGQLGSESTPQEFLRALWACTAEWMRVLKPRGSIFVNLGDKLVDKALLGLPWRYALGCTDELGLTLREEIIWGKLNGVPESVKDRCRRCHEQVFHFTRSGDYYSAVDRIREEHTGNGRGKTWKQRKELGEPGRYGDTGDGASGAMIGNLAANPLGKLPPSIWDIPLAPLNVPRYLAEDSLDGSEFDFDHYAAFPPALPAKIILGFSPKDVCLKCGQGRFPASAVEYQPRNPARGEVFQERQVRAAEQGRSAIISHERWMGSASHRILGNACACTPYIDHPGDRRADDFEGNDHPARSGGEWKQWRQLDGEGEYGRLPVREYLLDQWEAPPSVPGVVCDPCGGTGTTAITAAKMSRRGITCDLGYDYAKHLVDWRMHDLSQNRRKK
jgi:DNA modification methylase